MKLHKILIALVLPLALLALPLSCGGQEPTAPSASLSVVPPDLGAMLCDSIPQIETNNQSDLQLRDRLHGRCSTLETGS